MIENAIIYNETFSMHDSFDKDSNKVKISYQIDKYCWSDLMILNQNKKIWTKVDRKIKQTKSQFEWEFKTAVIEENKLLSIIIEDEYKENKEIAKFVWKSEEQISDFPWLNIEKEKKIFTEHCAKTNRIFASIREDVTRISPTKQTKHSRKPMGNIIWKLEWFIK